MSPRYHYMDQLRSLLMMLGVVFHTSRIYDNHPWLVQDRTSPFFDFVVAVINTFRMPAFFIVAGFFAAYLLMRDESDFLRKRMLRLAVPFAASAILINGLQVTFTHPADPFGAWLGGRWLSHLWFLFYLIGYTWVAVMVERLRPRLHASAARMFESTRAMACVLIAVPIGLLVTRKVSQLAVLSVKPELIDWVSELPVWLIYFLFGMYWQWSKKRLFPAPMRWLGLLTLAGGAVMAAEGISPWPAVSRAAQTATAFWSALLCIECAVRWLDRPTRAGLFLSEASYTVYLFHQVFVVMLGTLLLPWEASPFVKAPAIMAAVAVITLAIHLLLRRTPVLSLLFNGKIYRTAVRDGFERLAMPLTPRAENQ